MEYLDYYSVSRIQEACWDKDGFLPAQTSCCCAAVMPLTPSLRETGSSAPVVNLSIFPDTDPDYQLPGTCQNKT